MDRHTIEKLMERAAAGIRRDGLCIEPAETGYRVSAGDEAERIVSARELERRARNDLSPYVTNWYYWDVDVGGQGGADRAFFRWLERADDVPVPERYERLESGTVRRAWGELSITVRLNERGGRRYDLIHRSDRDASLDELDLHVDPLDARALAKYTDDGAYRPLKGAPDLQTGWVFSGLGHEKLVRTVDFFYPASVENWFRERNGTLDVTHFREAADRHTGIYRVIETIDSDRLTSLVGDCCTDRNCLKRRLWQESATRDLDVPSGDGSIPCREPCPFFLEEARNAAHKTSHSSEEASA